jgi:TPP-dependent 2-oxoacid decarboxylase
MGKGSVPENLPTFGGIYGGIASFPEPKKAIESSDCVLWLGNYPVSKVVLSKTDFRLTSCMQSDFNT